MAIEPRIESRSRGKAFDARSLISPRGSLEDRFTVDGDKGPPSPGCGLFQGDKLMFDKGFDIRAVQVKLVGSILK
jgi:hypothetical protein